MWSALEQQAATPDGWFGLALALLNVLQTLALAYMASRSRLRRGTDTPSGRSGTTAEDATGRARRGGVSRGR